MYAATYNPVQFAAEQTLGILTGAAYLALSAPAAIVGHTFATLLPAIVWLLRALFADSRRMDKPTRLTLALCVVAAGTIWNESIQYELI